MMVTVVEAAVLDIMLAAVVLVVLSIDQHIL